MTKLEKIVIATHNPAKIQRFKDALLKVTDNILTLADLGITVEAEETGLTAEENAKIKALFYAKLTGLPVFSHDSALYVDFLPADNQPGVNVRRINGKEATDDELFDHWKTIIIKAPEEKRIGKWHSAYCLATPDGTMNLFAIDHPRQFFWPPSEKRIVGWPLDSMMGPCGFNKPCSELTDEEREEAHKEADDVLAEKIPEFFRQVNR